MCSALSVRIVTVDSYMCAPHRNLDNIYSEFRGSAVYQVPVLRIFGSTEAGQKVCVHMHGVYPYLYIPHDGSGDANCLMYELAANIDKAINVSLGQASSKLQHVYKITLVSGIPFYGYHSRNHQFFKIYMYNPLLLRKVNNLLQSETILGKMYQPHESHIPFALQFMIDYNLHGMSFLNLSEVKYRVSDAPSLLNQTISSPADIEKVTRCEIEADALAENIMNKIDNFQENAASNPGIAALWDDERQRRRNKNEDSQLPHFLDAVDENYQNVTQSHLVFKNALEQRLILSSDKESEESVLNLSVYPAETPSSSKFLNASVVGSHCTSESTSMNDTSMFLSFIDDGDVTLQANQTIDIEEDADAQQLLVLLNELGQNAKEPEEDSILSQFQKDKEDEEENELNLTMSEITTPAIDDDLLNLSMSSLNIPQLDGNCSDELPPDMKSKKLGYCTCDKSKKNVKCKRCYQLNTTEFGRNCIKSINTKMDVDKHTKIFSLDGALDSDSSDDMISPTLNYKSRREIEVCGKSMPTEILLKNNIIDVDGKSVLRKDSPVALNKNMAADLKFENVKLEEIVASPGITDCDNMVSEAIQQEQQGLKCLRKQSLGSTKIVETTIHSSNDSVFEVNSPHCCKIETEEYFYKIPIAPTRKHVVETMDSYKIPRVKNQEPFFSNVEDVTESIQIGHTTLKVNCKTTFSLSEFESNFNSINDYRKCEIGDTRKINRKDLDSLSLSFCERKDCIITPVNQAPTLGEIKKWEKKKFTKRGQQGSVGHDCVLLGEEVMESDKDEYHSADMYNSSSESIFQVSSDEKQPLVPQLTIIQDSFSGSDSANERSCLISGVTLNNTYGFSKTTENMQECKAVVEYECLTVLAIELHVSTRADLNPDPSYDPICALFYSILNDVPENCSKSRSVTGIIAVNCLPGDAAPNKFILDGCLTHSDVTYVASEENLVAEFIELILKWDPDIFAGYEIEMLSWGYLIERANKLSIPILSIIGRVKETANKFKEDQNELSISGRICLDVWRLMRHEIALQSYTFESIVYHILHKRVPMYTFKDLTFWWNHKSSLFRYRTVEYYLIRVSYLLELMDKLDLLGRTSELARLFGIQFYEVLSRGSQFRVESMMLRLAKPLNYVPVSPSVQQRAKMRAPEYISLILEPESQLYVDPVIVLDFQSLYPSLIIAYNYCFSTCLGRVEHLGKNSPFEFGATQLRVSKRIVQKLLKKDYLNFSPCGAVFVKHKVRDGILPRMLREILDTRLMVKNSMKDNKSNSVLQKVLHNRQLGLKLIANVTYGYTSANFSGRMPSVEVADSVVSKGRETLQRAINLVHNTPRWGARVVYGDTDSLFVLVSGKARREAFEIGSEIADAVTKDNPNPVKLKLEKVYQPCILQTKKRYVGYMYESPDQENPSYDAKGIETVRRDGCPAVSKILEKCLRLLFEKRDVSLIKNYLFRQFIKIISGRVNMQDLIFAKEYRGASGYRPGACVPSLELARKWTAVDKRSEPRSGQRVPYVIINGPPGLPLIKLVRSPKELLSDSSLRPNALYYISRVIVPPINRCFSLIGVNVNLWVNDVPRKYFSSLAMSSASPGKKSTISQYFSTVDCLLCGEQTKDGLCANCFNKPQISHVTLTDKMSKIEECYHGVSLVCRSCTGSMDEVTCLSLDCPVTFRRYQTKHDLQNTLYIRELLDNQII